MIGFLHPLAVVAVLVSLTTVMLPIVLPAERLVGRVWLLLAWTLFALQILVIGGFWLIGVLPATSVPVMQEMSVLLMFLVSNGVAIPVRVSKLRKVGKWQ